MGRGTDEQARPSLLYGPRRARPIHPLLAGRGEGERLLTRLERQIARGRTEEALTVLAELGTAVSQPGRHRLADRLISALAYRAKAEALERVAERLGGELPEASGQGAAVETVALQNQFEDHLRAGGAPGALDLIDEIPAGLLARRDPGPLAAAHLALAERALANHEGGALVELVRIAATPGVEPGSVAAQAHRQLLGHLLCYPGGAPWAGNHELLATRQLRMLMRAYPLPRWTSGLLVLELDGERHLWDSKTVAGSSAANLQRSAHLEAALSFQTLCRRAATGLPTDEQYRSGALFDGCERCAALAAKPDRGARGQQSLFPSTGHLAIWRELEAVIEHVYAGPWNPAEVPSLIASARRLSGRAAASLFAGRLRACYGSRGALGYLCELEPDLWDRVPELEDSVLASILRRAPVEDPSPQTVRYEVARAARCAGAG